MNGWQARLTVLRDIINQPGGVALLILAFLLAQGAGWIPSAATTIAQELRTHDQHRIETDEKLSTILKQLSEEVARRNRIDRLLICQSFTAPELRAECLR